VPFDFPNTPAEGATYSPANGPQYIFQNGVWKQVTGGQSPVLTAETRNRIVNGAMQISQENGETVLTSTSQYPADQWSIGYTAAGSAANHRHHATTSPNGSRWAVLLSCVTPKVSLAAADNYRLFQKIEGNRVSDFQWGSSGARQAILRFWYYGRTGTFSVALHNSGDTRTFLAPFTVSDANTWTPVTVVIPGDTSGTWLVDNTTGISLSFIVACGTTYLGAAGWQAGAKYGLTGQTNGLDAVGSMAITDVGLYLDPDNTGVAPPWQMPDEAEELRACQRYWQQVIGWWSGATTSTALGYYSAIPYVVTPRPGMTFVGVNNGANNFPATSGTFAHQGSAVRELRSSNAAGSNSSYSSVITVNARM